VVSLDFPTRRSAQIARSTFADKAASKRRRVKVDGRSWQAVAIRKRLKAYAMAIGEAADSPAVRARILELCELEVLVAQLRANSLKGEPVDPQFLFELTRMTNSCNRLRHSLGLSDRPPEVIPTLESYRRKREAQP
jgi:hypothetical protein